jgi:hypothetical protein
MRMLVPRRESVQRIGTTVLGIVMILHGLGHAVLPLRGAGVLEGDSWTYALTYACYATALVGFVAAGAGVLGIVPFRQHVWWLALIAAVASMIAFRMLGDVDLWPGMLFDLTLPVGATWVEAHQRPTTDAPRGAARRAAHTMRQITGALFVCYVAGATLLWPWHRHWGTTPAERAMALPGDPFMRQPAFELMHGVSIDAPPEHVWRWLVQLGQDRGGFYSYDWLERLFGADIRNVDELRPEWQHRAAGDFVRAAQRGYLGGLLGQELGWYVAEVEPNRTLVLHGWGTFVLQGTDGGGTRLLIRSTFGNRRFPVWAAAISFTTFELPHFIMERRMLLGIKQRAERARSHAQEGARHGASTFGV